MNYYIWGDPHFGHKNILKFEPPRPFKDINHMDSTIIRSYNETVEDGDVIFWLGDMFFCNTERMKAICNKLDLEGKRNIVIRGNHDNGISDSKFKRLGFMPYKMYLHGHIILTHQPMTRGNIANIKRLSSKQSRVFNAHAHTHGANTNLDPYLWQCVSMEKINYTPISINKLLDKRFQEVKENKRYSLDYFESGDHLR
jgi:calcineurin-like phosphoesterase family protein